MANTTSLKLPDNLKDKVSEMAQGVAQTPHAYMVEAIAEKVARDEKRREFLAAADKSEEHFARTGIAFRNEDVRKYLRARAIGKAPKRPKPTRVPRSER